MNLLGNDIGTNYKPILSIGTGSNQNITGTLQTVTDGDGNTTPFQLSSNDIKFNKNGGIFYCNMNTFRVSHPSYSGSYYANIDNNGGTLNFDAIGAGTIYNFKLNGASAFQINSNSQIVTFAGGGFTDVYSGKFRLSLLHTGNNNQTLSIMAERNVSTSINAVDMPVTFGPSSGTGLNMANLCLNYVINSTGSTTASIVTGYCSDVTETSLTGITHNLMDLKVGGVSQFKVNNSGVITANSFISNGHFRATAASSFYWNGRSDMTSPADGIIKFTNQVGNDFSRLQFGGTTNAFPAIKRSGAAIDFRLADDSGYCNVNANIFFAGSAIFHSSGYLTNNSVSYTRFNFFNTGYSIEYGASNIISASAIFELKSTTQGFLPPRMTTAQRNAISSPATGLMVFDTDLDVLMVKGSVAWLTL